MPPRRVGRSTRSNRTRGNASEESGSANQGKNDNTVNVGGNQPQPDPTQFVQALTGAVKQQLAPNKQQSELVEFKKLTTVSFNGVGGPIATEDGILEMEKTFEGMHCSEGEKVTCGTFMLKGGAYDCWLMEKRKNQNEQNPYTWDMFNVAFYEKYYSMSVRRENESAFLKLVHGSMTVVAYDAEFARLSKIPLVYCLIKRVVLVGLKRV